MHLVEIILLLLIFIWGIQAKHWLDKVKSGAISFYTYLVTVFLMLVMILAILWIYSFEAITIICYGMFTGLILISIINTKTKSSEISQEDLRIWSGYTTLLMFGTGALTLMIHVPDSLSEIILLLGFISSVFYYVFLYAP